MIEINLLPEDLKVKVKAKNLKQTQTILKSPKENSQDQLFIFAIPVLLGLFICAHLYFALVTILKNGKLVTLNRRWIELEPQKKAFDEFNKEFSSVTQDASITRSLTSQRVL